MCDTIRKHATIGVSQLAPAEGTPEDAIRTTWVPNDALLARRGADDASALRRAHLMHRGDRQPFQQVEWRRMVRRKDNKLNGLINAAEHNVMSAVDDATVESRQ